MPFNVRSQSKRYSLPYVTDDSDVVDALLDEVAVFKQWRVTALNPNRDL